MSLKIGDINISNIRIGSQTPSRVYLGSQLVWNSWDPFNIDSFRIWLRGNELDEDYPVHNDPISNWNDYSGNGHDFVNATSGKQPVYDSNFGSHKAYFDGVDDYLMAAYNADFDNPYFTVGLKIGLGSGWSEHAAIIGKTQSMAMSAGWGMYVFSDNSVYAWVNQWSSINLSRPHLGDYSLNTLALRVGPTGVVFNVNGSQTTNAHTAGMTTPGSGSICIGAARPDEYNLNLHVHQLIYFNDALSDDDFASMITLLG